MTTSRLLKAVGIGALGAVTSGAITTIWTLSVAGDYAGSLLHDYVIEEANSANSTFAECGWMKLPGYAEFIFCTGDAKKTQALKNQTENHRQSEMYQYFFKHCPYTIIAPTAAVTALLTITTFVALQCCFTKKEPLLMTEEDTEAATNEKDKQNSEAVRKFSVNGDGTGVVTRRSTLSWDPRKFAQLLPSTNDGAEQTAQATHSMVNALK